MFKKRLKSEQQNETIFPLQVSVSKQNSTDDEKVKLVNMQNSLVTNTLEQINSCLIRSEEFKQNLATLIVPKLLELLALKYNFEPTEKYKEDAENKKKYINQLDEYLKERKEINSAVENDLQQFLQETTTTLSKALEAFNQNITSRIRDAENRYGIDAIKNALLNNEDKGQKPDSLKNS